MAFKLKLTNSPLPPTQTPFLTALGVVRGSTTPWDQKDRAPMFLTKQPLIFNNIPFPTPSSNMGWLMVE